MKTLIILEGLVKSEKLNWVRQEGLENFFVDINNLRKLFSNPDLFAEDYEVLDKSHADLVLKEYFKVIISRMKKGCMIVTDPELEKTKILEKLAFIFGYTIFYVIQPIPLDYVTKGRKYNINYYAPKNKSTLEKEVVEFLNIDAEDKIVISSFHEVEDYWAGKCSQYNNDNFPDDAKILHVSDVHSNYSLYKKLPDFKNYNAVIFYGDYIDGPEKDGNKKLIKEIFNDRKNKNVIWLEGNHELRLRLFFGSYLFSERNKDIGKALLDLLPGAFLDSTAKEFPKLTSEKAINFLIKMNSNLRSFFAYNYNGTNYICSHSGLRFIEQLTPKFIGNVINGGKNVNLSDSIFNEYAKDNGVVSIHAHCKYHDEWNPRKFENIINLDPKSDTEIIYAEQNNKDWNICQLER